MSGLKDDEILGIIPIICNSNSHHRNLIYHRQLENSKCSDPGYQLIWYMTPTLNNGL